MVLMYLFPWSASNEASFPHVLLSSLSPPVSKPILESQVEHSPSSLLAIIPILAFGRLLAASWLHAALNPSISHPSCKDPLGPINDLHESRPNDVGW